MPWHYCPGALHLHSRYSDGSGTIPQIAAAARKAGLSWIIITDHNTLAGLDNHEEGCYDGVAVFVGYELSPRRNHYLVFGTDQAIDFHTPPSDFIAAVRKQGGLGFVAHPADAPKAISVFSSYPWEDRTLSGFDGIEVWNYMSEWLERLSLRSACLRLLFPHTGNKGPNSKAVAWWDRLNVTGRSVGVGGLDTHAWPYKVLGRVREFFPYHDLFRTITNYLLLPEALSTDFETAKWQVYAALREGRCIIANRLHGDPHGFVFAATVGSREGVVGDTLVGNGPVEFRVDSPRWGRIVLRRNGEIIARHWGRTLRYVEPAGAVQGAYRAEVRLWGKLWLFTNPIYLRLAVPTDTQDRANLIK